MFAIAIWRGSGREYTFSADNQLVRWPNPGVGMEPLFTRHNGDATGICIYCPKDAASAGPPYFATEDHHDLIEYAAVDTYENILATANMLNMDINHDRIRLYPAYPKDSPYITFVRTDRIKNKMNIYETGRQLQNARGIIQQALHAIQQTNQAVQQANAVVIDAADVLTRA